MDADIAALYREDGPFVSVYLDACSAVPQAQQVLETRWKTVRSGLRSDGAPTGDLEAIDAVIRGVGHTGGDTLAAIAAGGRVLLAQHLPESSPGDLGCVGMLPWVGPLLATAQRRIPFVVVVADRTGAELQIVDRRGQAVSREVEGSSHEDTEAVKAGGWSQPRYERRAVKTWEDNAGEVADEVAAAAKAVGARLIAVGGDVHAVRLLREHLPTELEPVVRTLDPIDDTSLTRLVETVIAEDTVAAVRVLKEERGQHDRAADGPARVVEALQRATVETLLVHDDHTDDRRAWFGPDPTHVALDASTLDAMGAAWTREARLVDVCVRAAFGTSADVRVVPAALVTDGVSAVLRF